MLPYKPHVQYRRFKKEKSVTDTKYSVAGYATVYHHFAYPDKYRPRIRYTLTFFFFDIES